MALLDVAGLTAHYGSSQVLFGMDFAAEAGQCITLIGRNGMGKSTTFKSLLGMLPTARGRVTFDGRELAGMASYRIAQAGIGYVPEMRQIFPTLSVRENLVATSRGAAGRGAKAWTLERVYGLFPRLSERARHLGSQLSGGEQQMLAIGRALMTNPRLLILDEATEGLAPLVREEIWRVLGVLREAGHAMIVIDKYVHRLIAVADRQVIVEKGRVVWAGSSQQLNADRELWHRYLGL